MIKQFDNYTIEIKLADDYYSAFLTIDYHSECVESPLDNVLLLLKEANVIYGLKKDIIEKVCAQDGDVVQQLIAEGNPHRNGENAILEYFVDFESKAEPKVKEDGSVDFKEIGVIKTVKKGSILVRKTPATLALPGHTVTDKEIKGKNGKDVKIKRGENTVLIEDDTILTAETEGIAKMLNERVTIVKVIEVRVVGPETGNIYFGGDVHVKEHILDGYTVNCDGDLVVGGVVEGATLKVKGNMIVAKGILGHNHAEIVIDGNLLVKFIENANVYVKGEIETGEIINSSILCDSKIMVKGNKGLIIGGEITSKYIIEANRIGSKLGVLTSINLGVDASAIVELKHLKETVQELKIVEEKLGMMIPVLKGRMSLSPEDESLQQELKQYKDSLTSTRIDLEKKNKRLETLLEALKKVRTGQIKINTIYPDTIVKIGNSKYFVDYALKDCIITRENDKVIAIGF